MLSSCVFLLLLIAAIAVEVGPRVVNRLLYVKFRHLDVSLRIVHFPDVVANNPLGLAYRSVLEDTGAPVGAQIEHTFVVHVVQETVVLFPLLFLLRYMVFDHDLELVPLIFDFLLQFLNQLLFDHFSRGVGPKYFL